MAQLTKHFSDQELRVSLAEDRIKANAEYLCEKLLEPIRVRYGPLVITSGYRPPEHNAAVGGVHESEHQFDGDHAAADFQVPNVPLTLIFNWIRLDSGLPFRQVILEHDHETQAPACIHISTRSGGDLDKHEALIGATHGKESYMKVEAK
jgi:hypothetical protein